MANSIKKKINAGQYVLTLESNFSFADIFPVLYIDEIVSIRYNITKKEANRLQFFEVGKCYEGFRTFQDGYRLELTDDGLILYACMRGVTSEEKREFQSSKPFHMCYKIFGDVCFVCFKFGRLEWSDCPFAPGLYPSHDKHPQLPDFSTSDTLGFGLHIFLADSISGELFSIRQIGLGHEFSVQWCEWMAKYIEIPMTNEDYNEKIEEVYREYSTEALAKMSRFNSYRL